MPSIEIRRLRETVRELAVEAPVLFREQCSPGATMLLTAGYATARTAERRCKTMLDEIQAWAECTVHDDPATDCGVLFSHAHLDAFSPTYMDVCGLPTPVRHFLERVRNLYIFTSGQAQVKAWRAQHHSFDYEAPQRPMPN
jgi:hypothetical protein